MPSADFVQRAPVAHHPHLFRELPFDLCVVLRNLPLTLYQPAKLDLDLFKVIAVVSRHTFS